MCTVRSSFLAQLVIVIINYYEGVRAVLTSTRESQWWRLGFNFSTHTVLHLGKKKSQSNEEYMWYTCQLAGFGAVDAACVWHRREVSVVMC